MIPTFAHNGPVTNTSLQFAGYIGDNEVTNDTIDINCLYLGLHTANVLLRHGIDLKTSDYNDLYKFRNHVKNLINNLPPV